MCELVMEPKCKALFYERKALPKNKVGAYSQLMLSTSADLAARLRAAFERTGLTQAAFARECGASRQAVRSWLTTGRIDKVKLLNFARVAGTTVEALLGQKPPALPFPDGTGQADQIQMERIRPPIRRIERADLACAPQQAREAHAAPWPFTSFTPYEFNALPSDDRAAVEGFVRGLISARHLKSGAASGGG